MNPKFGDVYQWIDTKYKAMYVCPGLGESGWTGVVLCDDEGRPQDEFILGEDWIEQGVTEALDSEDDGWEKVE